MLAAAAAGADVVDVAIDSEPSRALPLKSSDSLQACLA